MQTETYIPNLSKGQQMGEHIRVAKAIFEDKYGFVTETNVKAWINFANEVRVYMGLKTLQETADKLEIKYRKLC